MATNSQDVQLNIRAVDYSKKTTDDVVTSLKALNAAQTAQIDLAKKGTASAADLTKSYNEITDALKALSNQDKLIQAFDTQNEKLDAAKTKLDAAREAQTQFIATLTPGADLTAKQSAALDRLAKSVAGAESRFNTAQAAVATTGDRLQKLGITSENAAQAQENIATAWQESLAVLTELRTAYSGLEAATAQRNADLAEEANAEKQLAVDIAFANAQRMKSEQDLAAVEAANAAAQRAQEAETERELNVDRQFTAAQEAMTAAVEKDTAARLAQAKAIQDAATAGQQGVAAADVTARGTAPVAQSNIAGQLKDIADPASAAAKNVDDLSFSINRLQDTVTAIDGPIKNYKDLLNDAQVAQKGLNNVAGQVDAYNKQLTALRASRDEFIASRTAVTDLVAALKSNTGGTDVVSQLSKAQAALRTSAQTFGDMTTTTRAMRTELEAAGVDVTKLAETEQQLIQLAEELTATMTQLNASFEEHGAAVNKSEQAQEGWLGGGRNTLSFAQRIRGELLGLAAGYIGVNAAINEAKDAIDSYAARQAILQQLLVANKGDTQAAADEFAYLRAQADALGFSFDKIGSSYAKFAIAGKTAGLSAQEIRFSFEQLATAAKNGGLSTDKFESVMVAFEQMLSKGSVQAQELRQQLGNALPGAFEIVAAKIGGTTAAFNDMMQAAQVGPAQIVQMADAIGEAYSKAGMKVNPLITAQNQLSNAVGDFQSKVAQSGFAAAYTDFLSKLSDFLESGDGDKLAQQLGGAFSSILDVLKLVVENFDLLEDAVGFLLSLKFLGWAMDAVKGIGAMRAAMLLLNEQILITVGSGISKAFLAMGAAAGTGAAGVGILEGAFILLTAAVEALIAAFPYLLAATAVFFAIKFAWDKFFDKDAATKAGAEAGKAGADAANKAASGVATPKPPIRDSSDTVYLNTIKDHNDALAKLEQDRLEAMKQGAKKDLAARQGFIDQSYDAQRNAAKATITNAQLLEIRLQDIQDESHAAQQNEAIRFANEQATTAESNGKKILRIQQDIQQALKAAQDDIAKRQGSADPTQDFADRTIANQKAVADAYDKTKTQIRELAAVGTKAATDQAAADTVALNAIIAQRIEIQKREDAQAEANRLEKDMTTEIGIQKAQTDAIKAKGATGELSPDEVVQQTNAAIAQTAPIIDQLGKKIIAFAEQYKALLTPEQYQKAISAASVAMSQNNQDAVTNTNNLNAAQAALNVTLANQAAELATIQAQQKLGLITSDQAADATNAVYAKYQQSILDSVNTVQQLIAVTRDLGGAPKAQLDALSASMTNLTLNTKNQIAATTQMSETFVSAFAQQGVTAVNSLGEALGKVVLGQESLAAGFKSAAAAAETFFAGVLSEIAQAIIKQEILNALAAAFGSSSSIGASAIKAGGAAASSSGGISSLISSFLLADGLHTGGVVGQGNPTFTRSVPSSIFAGAQRFHTGGLPGLDSSEVPTILQKGEEVLTRDDPRNVLNGGKNASTGSSAPQSTRFVLVDDRSKVADAMASAEGEKVTMVHLRRNIPTLKQWLK